MDYQRPPNGARAEDRPSFMSSLSLTRKNPDGTSFIPRVSPQVMHQHPIFFDLFSTCVFAASCQMSFQKIQFFSSSSFLYAFASPEEEEEKNKRLVGGGCCLQISTGIRTGHARDTRRGKHMNFVLFFFYKKKKKNYSKQHGVTRWALEAGPMMAFLFLFFSKNIKMMRSVVYRVQTSVSHTAK